MTTVNIKIQLSRNPSALCNPPLYEEDGGRFALRMQFKLPMLDVTTDKLNLFFSDLERRHVQTTNNAHEI